MDYELVAFDMDGTLVEEVSCWSVIHREFDALDKAYKNLQAWQRGEIEYEEFMRKDIGLWNPAPHISEIERILSDYKLLPKVSHTVKEIKSRGYKTAIISGGIDILAEEVAEELNISHVLANGLETDGDGFLTGRGICRVDPLRKDRPLKKLANDLGIGTEECVGIGNSVYDKSLFRASGLGIAVGDENGIEEIADIVIPDSENFDRILDYL